MSTSLASLISLQSTLNYRSSSQSRACIQSHHGSIPDDSQMRLFLLIRRLEQDQHFPSKGIKGKTERQRRRQRGTGKRKRTRGVGRRNPTGAAVQSFTCSPSKCFSCVAGFIKGKSKHEFIPVSIGPPALLSINLQEKHRLKRRWFHPKQQQMKKTVGASIQDSTTVKVCFHQLNMLSIYRLTDVLNTAVTLAERRRKPHIIPLLALQSHHLNRMN